MESGRFFGAIEDATIKGLNLKPGKTVYGKNQVAILAGNAVNSKVSECTVNGSVSAAGTAGGIVATIDGSDPSESVIENCTANVTIDANGGNTMFVGGIAGKSANSSLVDCRVETGDNDTARIQAETPPLEELQVSRMQQISITAMCPERLEEPALRLLGA